MRSRWNVNIISTWRKIMTFQTRRTSLLMVLTIFLATISAAIAGPPGGDITIRAEGFGTSKSDALLKAKRNAVEQGIGTVLMSETEVSNFELQKDTVLSKTLGAVKRYHLLQEKQLPDNSFYAEIEAVVSGGGKKAGLAALNILLESMNRPRTMVVMQGDPGRTAEIAITNFLTEKSFELVDPAVTAALMKQNSDFIQAVTSGDPATAARIGTTNGAEYLIIGQVQQSSRDTAYNMISGQAAITAKVINCSNARVIASASANSAFAHISADIAREKAVEKAAQELLDKKLFEKIITSFQDTVNNGIMFNITISGITRFKMQKAVKDAVNNLSDSISVSRRGFGNGQLQLTVRYKGDADAFSTALDGMTVNGRGLSVTDIMDNKITARMETNGN